MGIEPISMKEVKALLQQEEDEKRAGPGKKVAARSAALKDEPALKKHKKEQPAASKEQKINSFFMPLNMGTFPPPAGSPAVKVKSLSAVFGSAFIEAGAIPCNLSVSL